MPPPMRRGRRNRTLSRRGSKRAPTLNQTNQPQTARQSELESTVPHVRPPSAGSVVADRTLRRGPDVPFNRSLHLRAAQLERERPPPRVGGARGAPAPPPRAPGGGAPPPGPAAAGRRGGGGSPSATAGRAARPGSS